MCDKPNANLTVFVSAAMFPDEPLTSNFATPSSVTNDNASIEANGCGGKDVAGFLLEEVVGFLEEVFPPSEDLEVLGKYVNNDILLVLTKRDILPKSLYDENIKNYFKTNSLNIIDTVIISSTKNIGFDEDKSSWKICFSWHSIR